MCYFFYRATLSDAREAAGAPPMLKTSSQEACTQWLKIKLAKALAGKNCNARLRKKILHSVAEKFANWLLGNFLKWTYLCLRS